MTPQQWRLGRQTLAMLETDIGRTDADLAAMLGITLAELRPIIGVLYRQRKIDRCWDYVVLPSRPAGQQASAA
jgi:transcription initiation factor IIE alpha subunit